MLKTRLYIIRFLGIILLLSSYLLGNQPDNRFAMHFDSDPDCPSVFKADVYDLEIPLADIKDATQHHGHHKIKVPRHVVYTISIPMPGRVTFCEEPVVAYTIPLAEKYRYLFYEEINPPPPRSC